MSRNNHLFFHFTKDLKTLKLILKDGFYWPRYCLEDNSWIMKDQLAFPMVCFCDIPLGRIEDHLSFYGKYGIGMRRRWAEQSCNPLIYVNPRAELNEVLDSALCAIIKTSHGSGEAREIAFDKSMRLLAYVKPLSGKANRDGKDGDKDYYEESEWRFVPELIRENYAPFLHSAEYNIANLRDAENEKTRQACPLNFRPIDVTYIIVPTVEELVEMVNFIRFEMSEAGRYSGGCRKNELDLLITRLVSLDDLLPSI